jgi:TolB-like protein
MTWLLLCASLAAEPPPKVEAKAEKPSKADLPKLIVLPLQVAGGVETGIGSALTEAVTTEVSARGFFQVLSSKDVETLLSVERQRELLGCSEDSSNCVTELAGALGARFVLSGSVARLGEAYQLNLQTLDSQKAQPLGRSTLIGKDLGVLREQLKYVVAEATATPLPPPPSRVLQFSLIGVGAAAIVGGALVGLLAVSQEIALQRELSLGESNPMALRQRADYQAEVESFIRPMKTVSLVSMILGAALIVTGIIKMPSENQATGPGVSLVPSGGGAALVGVF